MKIDLTPRQTSAFKLLLDEKTRYLLYGGAKGGGKSYLLCIGVFTLCKKLCDLFELKPGSNPLPLGFIGRKRSNDFRKTTLETWKRFIPAGSYEIKQQQGEIWLFNGACKIFFGGLDNTDQINKFNSSELSFFCIDQAEETTREDVAVIRGALRLKHKGIQPHYKEFYTANPSDCWLKEDFVDRKLHAYAYIPALPADNPHLPDNYIQTLEEAFKHAQPLLRAYRDGDWSALKSSNNLISSYDLDKLKGLDFSWNQHKRVVACDPATSHDECVIYYMQNYRVVDQIILVGENDEMKIAGHIVSMANKHDCIDIGGDSIGLGAGIFSRVAELGKFRVNRINSSERAFSDTLSNKRAEVYWNMMKAVIDKRIYWPEDEELRRQLVNISYEVANSSGEIKITGKDAIKRVLGRSPDRADCYAYAIYLSDQAEQWVKPGVKKDPYDRHEDSDYHLNPATA